MASAKGIWVIAETNHTWQPDGLTPTSNAAWYFELQGKETIDQATQRALADIPLRSRLTVISDTNATTYDVAPTLTVAKT